MTAVLFEYYYPAGHLVGFSILCAGLIARPRFRAWLDRRRELARRVSILAAALLIAAASCALLFLSSRGQHERQALCGSVTLPITLLPGCSRVLPRADGPPAEPALRELVEPYLRQRQRPWPSAKIREQQRAAGRPASAPRAGNVLLVVLESTSARHLGVYGGRPQATPELDALARGCTRHGHAFATSNITGRGLEAIFGGIVRPRTTVERDPRVHPIFPELLAEAGYQTAFFGAALGMQDAGRFLRSERWSRFFDSFEAKSHSMRLKPPCEDDCHMLREIDAWLFRRDRSRPFLLVFAPYSTHFAYKTPDTWPVQFIRRRMQFYSPLFFPREELETVREYHANAVRYVDFAVGDLLRKLEAHGERGRTLVIVTADHGEDLYLRSEPSHGTSLFDSQVHVPLLVCPPGQGAAVREENASHLDIAPTVLSWAGLLPFAAYEGVDLLGQAAPPRALLLVNDFLVRGNAVILGRYKYTRDITRRSETLYDRRADPLERVNLAEREPGLVRAMRWILQDWLDRSPF
jgi:arylsulfatase A-like enzyme